MRKSSFVIAGLACLSLFAAANADDDFAAVKDLLAKAVQARGGAEKAAALNDVYYKGKARIIASDNPIDFPFELSVKDLAKARLDLTINSSAMTFVVTDDKIWSRNGGSGKADELPKEAASSIRAILMATLSPGNPLGLSNRKDLMLTHGGEAKVDDATAAVLRVGRKDVPDLTIYFDKKTGLPLKSETLIKENAQEQTFTFRFSDFKDDDGVKHFGKVKIQSDGKEMMEIEVTEFKAGAKFDSNTFEKP